MCPLVLCAVGLLLEGAKMILLASNNVEKIIESDSNFCTMIPTVVKNTNNIFFLGI